MPSDRQLFHWADIDKVPASTGIYAWYYKHLLADHDIRTLVGKLDAIGPDEYRRQEVVQAFLQQFLFDVFREQPYQILLAGSLKPTYRGAVPHDPTVSDGLVGRVATQPERLWALKKVLEEAIPEFASPIYIGMSVDLNKRVNRHKWLIETFKAAVASSQHWHSQPDADSIDHSFAREVVRRGFSPSRLRVAIRLIEPDLVENVHLDAENILNRINFPLCGRN